MREWNEWPMVAAACVGLLLIVHAGTKASEVGFE